MARWKDLCIDAADPHRMAEFWGRALHLRAEQLDDGDAVLRGDAQSQTVWINRVPEPKTVKHRVHLDLAAPDVQPFLDAGATVGHDDPSDGWLVLADPEGGELCVFPAEEPSALVVDSADPEADAAWWADALGAEAVVAPGGLRRWVATVQGLPWDLLKFVGVPEAKTVKNRIHWDVVGDVDALVGHGARILRRPDDEIGWHVMADPAGNEFCVFPPRDDDSG